MNSDKSEALGPVKCRPGTGVDRLINGSKCVSGICLNNRLIIYSTPREDRAASSPGNQNNHTPTPSPSPVGDAPVGRALMEAALQQATSGSQPPLVVIPPGYWVDGTDHRHALDSAGRALLPAQPAWQPRIDQDDTAKCYRRFFVGREHVNLVGRDGENGPVLVSVKAETVAGQEHWRVLLRLRAGSTHELVPAANLGPNPSPAKMVKSIKRVCVCVCVALLGSLESIERVRCTVLTLEEKNAMEGQVGEGRCRMIVVGVIEMLFRDRTMVYSAIFIFVFLGQHPSGMSWRKGLGDCEWSFDTGC
ncbi:Rap1 GTPase-activating protein 1 [Eufriesea mexicana]|uniref:Rap1 GTPase-activating protein 1 n=1 Tax=Eufriesea mexicana TaxID=516756 RepID=A0A310SBP9_9HYME|nr:Rap1 GTPase-activating protein 1 [Eufriesea mexicana]